jgi:hypothetical protein
MMVNTIQNKAQKRLTNRMSIEEDRFIETMAFNKEGAEKAVWNE